jgi:trans-aconitate 2-methyltransferase
MVKDWSWHAEEYAEQSSAQHAWARELISKTALRGDERLLDLGCGDGKITAELADNLPQGQASVIR